MPHRLGFAVKVLGDGGLPSHDTRRWQSGPHLRVSLERLEAIFDYLEAKDVRMYRMASGLAPYGSHPEMDRFMVRSRSAPRSWRRSAHERGQPTCASPSIPASTRC